MNDDHNEDWLHSRTWDLPFDDVTGLLKQNSVQDKPVDEQVSFVKHFVKLPVFKAAPLEMKKDVVRFLREH